MINNAREKLMIMDLKTIIKKYNDFFLSMIFGALATAINTAGYWLFYTIVELPNLVATALALIITIIFAFFTNKLFVYRSKSWKIEVLIKESFGFLICRALTGVFDMLFMLVTVDVLELFPVLMKLIAALLVGLMNYLAGKFLIFKRDNTNKPENL